LTHPTLRASASQSPKKLPGLLRLTLGFAGYLTFCPDGRVGTLIRPRCIAGTENHSCVNTGAALSKSHSDCTLATKFDFEGREVCQALEGLSYAKP